MSRTILLEGLGYLASVLIALSLMMRAIVRLRWINMAGAVCFTAYGIMIDAYPVAVLNFAVVLINAYFLAQAYRTREAFSVVEMAADEPYLREFLVFHRDDIHRFQPRFTFDPTAPQHVLLVLRDLVPAGVLILEPVGPGVAGVRLDFVTPEYRDFRIGRYLFDMRRDVFRALGIRRLETDAGDAAHARYLVRMGFRPETGGYGLDLGTT